ncbi:MAG: dGTPase, partial [Bryobacterales bacterium]|nr:dGTPase [Bryobacterales bacterium]
MNHICYPCVVYTDFDVACFPIARRIKDYRTPFAIDRDRIIHSRAFRRLQAKTQVFSTGEYDFYRTRLTACVKSRKTPGLGNVLKIKCIHGDGHAEEAGKTGGALVWRRV